MKKYAIIFFLLGSLVMVYVMATTDATLKTPATPHGILDLEFAYNTTKATVVMDAWAPNGVVDNIAAAKFNTWLDYIFLFFYSIFLFLASKEIARSFGGVFGRVGKLIARGSLVAGFLDVIENSGMLLTLSAHGSGTIAFCTSFCSIIKWALALLAVLYVMMGAVGLLRARLIK